MATIALTAVGTAYGGAVGGAIGAAVGGYIDREYIMPALFPVDPIEGPRFNELMIGGVDEGHPMNRAYGRTTRLSGTVIWSSELKETKTTEEVGGKGGSGQEVNNYTYSVDLAIEWCEGPPDGLGMEVVERIWADAGVVYDNNPGVVDSSTDISCTILEETHRNFFQDPPVEVVYAKTMRLLSTSVDVRLGELASGFNVLIAGFTETDYNGTFRCLSSRNINSTNSEAVFEIDLLASSAGEAAGNTITVTQTLAQGLLRFDRERMASIPIHHLGTEVQTADSLIEAEQGSGNVPGYRGVCYTTISDYQLAGHGNRIPTTWSAEVIRSATAELDETFADILGFSDLDASEYDVTALAGIVEKGYTSRGPMPTKSEMLPLMLLHDVLVREDDGVMVFFLRSNATIVDIDVGDLEAREGVEAAVAIPASWEDPDRQEPPREVLVKYVDEENDLQPGSQREFRIGVAAGDINKRVVAITVTMNGGEARDLAAKVLWLSWTNKRGVEIQVPQRYLNLQENDIGSFVYLGETYQFLIKEITDGINGVMLVRGFIELSASLIHTSPHELPQGTDSKLYFPPDMRQMVIDVAALRDSDTLTTGVYLAAATRDQEALYKGGSIFESQDDVNYSAVAVANPYVTQASIGICTTSLDDTTNRWAHWDGISSVAIRLFEGSLSSKTKTEIVSGANRALLGDEIVGFTTAVLEADGTYTISGFLRGLGATEYAMAEHVDGERFIFLNSPGIVFHEHSLAAVGSTRYYKAVAIGGDIDDSLERTTVLLGATVLPPDPVNLQGNNNSSNDDWVFSWRRRSRSIFQWIKTPNPPLLEDTESYEVDVMDGATVARTLTVTDATQVTYTAAQQVTDFGTEQTTVTFRVYQISARVGRGRRATETVSI